MFSKPKGGNSALYSEKHHVMEVLGQIYITIFGIFGIFMGFVKLTYYFQPLFLQFATKPVFLARLL